MGEGTTGFYWAGGVREVEQRAIGAGRPAYALMQRAAAGAFRELTRHWPRARRIALVCGPGNNGGDGFELARLARQAGYQVSVWDIAPSATATARKARSAWLADGGKVKPYRAGCLRGAEVIVDAIFGIGLSRAPDGLSLTAILGLQAAQTAGAGVLAIDVPSGLDADRGSAPGCVVVADCTVTFIARKPGLYTGAGPDVAGKITLDGLDLPASYFKGVQPAALSLEPPLRGHCVPPRRPAAHKGDHGHVLVIGGDQGMGGAALLAARGALRSGAGLVSVATHPAHAAALMAAQPEIMVHAVQSARDLRLLLDRATVLAVGPGLGRQAWGGELWAVAHAAPVPLVVDADALNWLADNPQRRDDWILTPHPGEAARLLSRSSKAVQADRLQAVQELAKRFGGVAVLKGAGTLVQGSEVALCPRGTPAMAVGGMGDVLCGVVAGLRAQGLEAQVAARTAVLVHALAGESAARRGLRGMLPSDVLDELPTVIGK